MFKQFFISRGFTLIEIMAAIAIFAIVIATATGSMNSYQNLNHQGEIRSEASQVAQSVLDEIRTVDIETLPASGSDPVRTITMNSNRPYAATVSYCTDPSYCTSGAVRQIHVEISHRDEVIYTTEAVFTDLGAAPGSTYSPTATPISTPTGTPTSTPTATATATATSTPTATATSTPTPTSTPTATPAPTATPKKKKCKTWKC